MSSVEVGGFFFFVVAICLPHGISFPLSELEVYPFSPIMYSIIEKQNKRFFTSLPETNPLLITAEDIKVSLEMKI